MWNVSLSVGILSTAVDLFTLCSGPCYDPVLRSKAASGRRQNAPWRWRSTRMTLSPGPLGREPAWCRGASWWGRPSASTALQALRIFDWRPACAREIRAYKGELRHPRDHASSKAIGTSSLPSCASNCMRQSAGPAKAKSPNSWQRDRARARCALIHIAAIQSGSERYGPRVAQGTGWRRPGCTLRRKGQTRLPALCWQSRSRRHSPKLSTIPTLWVRAPPQSKWSRANRAMCWRFQWLGARAGFAWILSLNYCAWEGLHSSIGTTFTKWIACFKTASATMAMCHEYFLWTSSAPPTQTVSMCLSNCTIWKPVNSRSYSSAPRK